VERVTRSALFLLVLAVFLLIPLRIIAYGYMPPDDAPAARYRPTGPGEFKREEMSCWMGSSMHWA